MHSISLLPVFAVAVIVAARIIEVRTKRRIIEGKKKETTTLRLFIVTEMGMVIGSLTEYARRGYPVSWGLVAGGLLCALCSFWIRRRAIAELGKFWSLHIEIRDNHELIRSGPFRWVRHPAYFSMILEVASIGIILHAFYMLAAIPVFFLPVLFLRLTFEEKALIEKFGEVYRQYRRETPALLPYKFPIRH